MEPLDKFKLLAALGIWLLALVGGTAPLLSRHRVSTRASSVLNMVAAGIFLASSCLHLLPDAQSNAALTEWGCAHTAQVFLAVRTRYDGDETRCFKWANFFYGCGFLMVLLLEVLAHTLQRRCNKGLDRHDEGTADERNALLVAGTAEAEAEAAGTAAAAVVVRDTIVAMNGQHCSSGLAGVLETGGDYGTQSARAKAHRVTRVDSADGRLDEPHAHIHGIVKGNFLLALVVFVALSFHSVMEGMGMGASSTPAWDILVAILAHKSLAAFALALELLHHNVPRVQLLSSIAVFSLMTPMGILFGRLLVDTTQATPAGGVCAALAGGTFLFVAMMEIIPQELQDPRYQLEKCAALLAGYGVMGMLSLWT
ncbi:unnamed protein product [Hyaloperonospora brassicae]|uniref:Uncharacterized protein n=1 Tax=Hyaloperonospora brassicae TaxID=162125 RepID=A0AAV0UBE2_HYABA|nr:unnamed protein product [Hyaloperonospora brassicae]